MQYQQKYKEDQDDVQLMINITLGKVKYTLRVPQVSNLIKLVQQFIHDNSLNMKYHKTILNLVEKKLQERETQNRQKLRQIQKQNRFNQNLKESCKRTSGQKLIHNQKLKNRQQKYQNAKAKHPKEDYERIHQNNSKIDDRSKQKRKNMMLKKIQQQIKHAACTKQNQSYQSDPNYEQNDSPKDNQEYSYHKPYQNNKYKNYCQEQDQQIGSKQVYQKWKTKQKQKNQKNIGKNSTHQRSLSNCKYSHPHARHQNAQNQKIQSVNSQPIDEDWFYKKGLYFEQKKQQHNKKLFDQIYPFTTQKQLKINQSQKQKLHNRLFKDKQKNKKQVRMLKSNASKNQQLRPNNNKFWNSELNVNMIKGLSPTMRKRLIQKNKQIKDRIKQKDEQIDLALDQMIKQGVVKNPCVIRKVSLSPFRRTILK